MTVFPSAYPDPKPVVTINGNEKDGYFVYYQGSLFERATMLRTALQAVESIDPSADPDKRTFVVHW